MGVFRDEQHAKLGINFFSLLVLEDIGLDGYVAGLSLRRDRDGE
jgi:hypothetical protein